MVKTLAPQPCGATCFYRSRDHTEKSVRLTIWSDVTFLPPLGHSSAQLARHLCNAAWGRLVAKDIQRMIPSLSSTSSGPAISGSTGLVMPPGRTSPDTGSHRPDPQNPSAYKKSATTDASNLGGARRQSSPETTTAGPALSAETIARNQKEKAHQMSTLESIVRAITTSPDGPALAEVSPAPADYGARKYEQNVGAVRASALDAPRLRSPGDVADLRI
jgi:hypothetical protein